MCYIFSMNMHLKIKAIIIEMEQIVENYENREHMNYLQRILCVIYH